MSLYKIHYNNVLVKYTVETITLLSTILGTYSSERIDHF